MSGKSHFISSHSGELNCSQPNYEERRYKYVLNKYQNKSMVNLSEYENLIQKVFMFVFLYCKAGEGGNQSK